MSANKTIICLIIDVLRSHKGAIHMDDIIRYVQARIPETGTGDVLAMMTRGWQQEKLTRHPGNRWELTHDKAPGKTVKAVEVRQGRLL